MIKKIICSILFFCILRESACLALPKRTDELTRYCEAHYRDFMDCRERIPGEWKKIVEKDEKTGEEKIWMYSPDGKKKFRRSCFFDMNFINMVDRIYEDNFVPHNGLNIEVDRLKLGLYPLPQASLESAYDIWASTDQLGNLEERIKKSVKSSHERLKKYKEDVKKHNEAIDNTWDLSRWFYPKNGYTAKAATTIGLITSSMAAAYPYLNTEKKEKTKKDHKHFFGLSALFGLFAFLFSCGVINPRGYKIFPNEEYYTLRNDYYLKSMLWSNLHSVITGEPFKKIHIGDYDLLEDGKTRAGIPIIDSIKKHGIVITMPTDLDSIWPQSGMITMNSQVRNYYAAIKDFGEAFVKDPEHNEPKIKAKYIPKK